MDLKSVELLINVTSESTDRSVQEARAKLLRQIENEKQMRAIVRRRINEEYRAIAHTHPRYD